MQRNNRLFFIGCGARYDESEIVIFGAGFDSTSSNRPGSRFAPGVIRTESYGIETFSPYLDKDLQDYRVICDFGDLELPFGNPVPALDIIEEFSRKIYSDGKLPFMIGGEHLVTLGSVKAAVKKYPDLNIIHFDAHTDLRDDYLGEKLSHATVIRRCAELLNPDSVYQYGIRSGERAEFEWAKSHTKLTRFGFDGLQEGIAAIGDKPVYLTIDLDVLDPSVFGATGTPEAGGVTFMQLIDAIKKFKGLNVVGVDVNELCPPYDTGGVSASTACKVIRELLLILLSNH